MTLDEARAGIGRTVVFTGPNDSPDDEDVFGVITAVKAPFVKVRFESNEHYSHAVYAEWIDFPVVVRG